MAYSCAYWTSDDPSYTLQDAQRDKLDLVCRKLGLRPGMRMLDIGCGWGSLSLHAAEQYGVNVIGVTLSAEQRAFVEARIEERGLQDRVEVRLQDYREVQEPAFDAITSIEMGEHVGKRNYPLFAVADPRPAPAGWAGAGAADVTHAAAPAAAPSSRRSSPPTCTCARWVRPWR